MSLKRRLEALEQAYVAADTVCAFQLHNDNQELIDMVVLCGDMHHEHPMSLDEFDRRYAHMARHIIRIEYVDAEDWNVHQ